MSAKKLLVGVCNSYWTVAVLNILAGFLSLCLLWVNSIPVVVAVAVVYMLTSIIQVVQGQYNTGVIQQLRHADQQVREQAEIRVNSLRIETDDIIRGLTHKAFIVINELRQVLFKTQVEEARMHTFNAGYNLELDVFNMLKNADFNDYVTVVYLNVTYDGTGEAVVKQILALAKTLPDVASS
jgi:hypothetical protein